MYSTLLPLDPVEEVPVMSEVSELSSVSVAHMYGDGGGGKPRWQQ